MHGRLLLAIDLEAAPHGNQQRELCLEIVGTGWPSVRELEIVKLMI